MSFNQFRLSSDILKGLNDVKLENPSSLQKKIFKTVQQKKDLVINTTVDENPEVGYLISLLNEISKSDRREGTKAVVLTATKERAKVLDEWIWAIGYHASIESACMTDDGNPEEQLSALMKGPVIIVATPERFSDLLEKGRIIFREVQQLIVDQAELIEDWSSIEGVSNRVIGNCQRIFTAAKDSKELREAENKMLNEPELVTLSKKKTAEPKSESKESQKPAITKDLTQYYINVPPRSKISTLMAHLDNHTADSVLIFTASRKTADRLYKILRKSNKRAVSLHDKVDKDTFNERFGRFTSGNVQHMIVGQMSAGEIPLDHAAQVINYDVPEDVKEYKLRADLVGNGKATRMVSLVSKQDRSDINSICKSLGFAPEEIPLPKTVKDKLSSRDKSKPKRGKNKSRGKSNQKKKRSARKLNELPRPTFDQLEGGRSGKKKKSKEQSGIIGFFKKLFE
ncbi:DEAD/DEAH box helicase [Rhodohalobacter sp. 614A]|uniref:DEAD/DEAH box helicase n=1 Tax=Rhodohalobacter sp. 614A TaxID=2908649 RepID=UPI001F3DF822|nr:DEAD/DEAH box helicase [Rhodohalobacter sp. 614A]